VPSISLSAGNTEELVSRNDGQTLFLRADGDVRVAKHSQVARHGRQIPADSPAEIELREREETVYVHADESATITYEWQGFSLSLFGREIVRVNGDESTGELPQNTARVAADSVTEVNADQTANVPNGSSQTTTVTADSGEVWTLSNIYLQYNYDSSIGTDSGDRVSFTVETEKEGVIIGEGKTEPEGSFDQIQDWGYRGGQWYTSRTDQNLVYGRDGMDRTRIDDTNGLSVTFTNNAGDPVTTTRNIRLQFEVTKV
jgi:hypothetical protein